MKHRRGNNEGSIYRRKDGTWCGAVSSGRDREGNPIRKYVYGKTRQEVSNKLVKLLQDYQVGLLPTQGKKVTFGQWLWTYLNLYKKPQIRETTYELYSNILKNHLPTYLASLPLEKVRPEDLQRLFLEKEGRTMQILRNFIHGALKQAMRLGYVPRNVAEATTPPRNKKKEVQVLSREDIKKFIASSQDHRLFPAFFLLLTTGLRRGELLGLQWSDVDLERGTITVSRSLIYLKGKFIFQEPKTKGSSRTIPLPEVTQEVLKEWKRKWLEERMALGANWPKTDLVFPTEVHTPINPRNFGRTFKDLLKKAELSPTITIHGLRHTYATLLLSAGEHPKVVQELLGHSSITITMDTYSKVAPGLKEKAVEKLNAILNNGSR